MSGPYHFSIYEPRVRRLFRGHQQSINVKKGGIYSILLCLTSLHRIAETARGAQFYICLEPLSLSLFFSCACWIFFRRFTFFFVAPQGICDMRTAFRVEVILMRLRNCYQIEGRCYLGGVLITCVSRTCYTHLTNDSLSLAHKILNHI